MLSAVSPKSAKIMAAAVAGIPFGPVGVIAGGIVTVAGWIWLKNVDGAYVFATVGEKLLELERTTRLSHCCCGAVGPSGKFKVHCILKSSRKEAEDAARHYANANGVEYHSGTASDSYPHFHPTRNGVKIPGVHFQFPG
jgi:hypothetical protein